MAMTDTLAHRVLNHLLGIDNCTIDTLYLGLLLSPTEEVTGGSYERVELSSKVIVNADTMELNENLSFPIATANWGLITNIGVYNSATGGDLYFFGATSSVRSVSTGETYTLLAGNFSIQLT